MPTSLLLRWREIRSSYWFIPTLMMLGAVVAAFAATAADEEFLRRGFDSKAWFWGGGPAGARSVLSTVAGLMITVAGVTFSVTIVALVLASSQFGPRLLVQFMRDTGNQVVLGTFIATFAYCLVVIQAVRGEGGGAVFVPHLAVGIALLLALLSVGVFIFFIHHVSTAIRADHVIALVKDELAVAIDALYDEEATEAATDDPSRREALENFQALAHTAKVRIETDGYLQTVDVDCLVELATVGEYRVAVERRPGRFLVAEQVVASLYSERELKAEDVAAVAAAFIVGPARSLERDVEFAVSQLVEVALRALSPGINDPFTAMTCIDWLGAALLRIAARGPRSPLLRDAEGATRILLDVPDLFDLSEYAFAPIAEASGDHQAVRARLRAAIEQVAEGSGSRGLAERILELADC